MYVPTEADLRIAEEGALHSVKFHPEYISEATDLSKVFSTSPTIDKTAKLAAMKVLHAITGNDNSGQELKSALVGLIMYGYVLRDEIEDMYEAGEQYNQIDPNLGSSVAD